MQSCSEVALLKAQIEAETQAAQRGMHGPSVGLLKHQFITIRMERMGILHERLKNLIGEDEATEYLIDAMNKISTPQKLL